MFADVNLLVRFANLESKLGDKERAQTLFENILSSYPKRVDVWSCYVDCLIKSKDIDLARYIFYRFTTNIRVHCIINISHYRYIYFRLKF